MTNEVKVAPTDLQDSEQKSLEIAPAVQRRIKDLVDLEAQEAYEQFSSFANEKGDWVNLQDLSEAEEDKKARLINQWFEEEGFDVDEHEEKRRNESYKFKAHMKNEKFQRDYVIEVKDHGASIRKVKWLIV